MEEFNNLEKKFKGAVSFLVDDLSKIHANKVTATLLKPIMVRFEDGRNVSMMEAGLVRSINAKTLAIKPWMESDLSAIEKAIKSSNLGANIGMQDNEIHIIFPELTQERRKELAKSINVYANDAKHKIREYRHSFIKENKKPTKEEEIKMEKNVQKLIDKYNDEIEKHLKNKQNELNKI